MSLGRVVKRDYLLVPGSPVSKEHISVSRVLVQYRVAWGRLEEPSLMKLAEKSKKYMSQVAREERLDESHSWGRKGKQFSKKERLAR